VVAPRGNPRAAAPDAVCDILVQGLIGLIEYLYHQGIPSFSEAQLKKLWVKRAWLRAILGWVTDLKVRTKV
jgi:hypothetical protein